MKHKVISLKRFGEYTYELVCTRENIQFIPGDCVGIRNSYTTRSKPYSIASSPKEDLLRFYVKLTYTIGELQPVSVSQFVSSLRSGEEIDISEPFGYFRPGKNGENRKYIYIATGTGMAPFVSALGHYTHKPEMILYGVRYHGDIVPIPANDLGLYNIAVSNMSNGLPKRIDAYYSMLPTDKPTEYDYYLCGLEEMISDCSQYLTQRGVPTHHIQMENFYTQIH